MKKSSFDVLLRRFLDTFDTQQAAAKQMGVAPSYLSDVARGRREPGEKILAALGLKRVIQYEER